MSGFINFIKEQGVMGLAIGFIMGGAVTKLVNSVVVDLVNPVLGILLGKAGNLSSYSIMIGNAEIKWGSFLASTIDFVVISAIVYITFLLLKIDKEKIKIKK